MTAARNAPTAAAPDAGGPTGAGAVRNWLRGGLALLAAIQAVMGGWQYLAPRSFYYDIPTVSADRPFSAHLMTDVGGLNLALAVVLAAAAWRLDQTLTRVALAAYLVYSGSHLAFHATDQAPLTPGQQALLLTSLALLPAIALALLLLSRKRPARPDPTPGDPGNRGRSW
jgi:hypothetical protein